MYLNPAFQSLEWTERRRPRTEEMNTCYQCRSDPGFLPQQLDIHMRPCIIFRDLISMLPFSCLSFLLSLALTLLSSLFSQFFLLSLLSLRASTRTLRITESWQRIQFFFLLPVSVLLLEFIHLFKKKTFMSWASAGWDTVLRFFPLFSWCLLRFFFLVRVKW